MIPYLVIALIVLLIGSYVIVKILNNIKVEPKEEMDPMSTDITGDYYILVSPQNSTFYTSLSEAQEECDRKNNHSSYAYVPIAVPKANVDHKMLTWWEVNVGTGITKPARTHSPKIQGSMVTLYCRGDEAVDRARALYTTMNN